MNLENFRKIGSAIDDISDNLIYKNNIQKIKYTHFWDINLDNKVAVESYIKEYSKNDYITYKMMKERKKAWIQFSINVGDYKTLDGSIFGGKFLNEIDKISRPNNLKDSMLYKVLSKLKNIEITIDMSNIKNALIVFRVKSEELGLPDYTELQNLEGVQDLINIFFSKQSITSEIDIFGDVGGEELNLPTRDILLQVYQTTVTWTATDANEKYFQTNNLITPSNQKDLISGVKYIQNEFSAQWLGNRRVVIVPDFTFIDDKDEIKEILDVKCKTLKDLMFNVDIDFADLIFYECLSGKATKIYNIIYRVDIQLLKTLLSYFNKNSDFKYPINLWIVNQLLGFDILKNILYKNPIDVDVIYKAFQHTDKKYFRNNVKKFKVIIDGLQHVGLLKNNQRDDMEEQQQAIYNIGAAIYIVSNYSDLQGKKADQSKLFYTLNLKNLNLKNLKKVYTQIVEKARAYKKYHYIKNLMDAFLNLDTTQWSMSKEEAYFLIINGYSSYTKKQKEKNNE